MLVIIEHIHKQPFCCTTRVSKTAVSFYLFVTALTH